MVVKQMKFYVVSEGDTSVGISPFTEEIILFTTYYDKDFLEDFNRHMKETLESAFENGAGFPKVFTEKEYNDYLDQML